MLTMILVRQPTVNLNYGAISYVFVALFAFN